MTTIDPLNNCREPSNLGGMLETPAHFVDSLDNVITDYLRILIIYHYLTSLKTDVWLIVCENHSELTRFITCDSDSERSQFLQEKSHFPRKPDNLFTVQ